MVSKALGWESFGSTWGQLVLLEGHLGVTWGVTWGHLGVGGGSLGVSWGPKGTPC